MKICLIRPPKLMETDSTPIDSHPPLGIALLAALLIEAGHDVKAIDGIVENASQILPVELPIKVTKKIPQYSLSLMGLTFDEIASMINPKVEIIGISSMFSINWVADRALIAFLADRFPGASVPHESAHLHVSGEARYVDDLPELAGTLHATLGLSARAHARIVALDLATVLAAPGVHGVITAKDIPGHNDCGPIVADDPTLADGVVMYIGQPVFAVLADTHDQARRAARLAHIEYQDLPAQLDPVAAAAVGALVLPPMRLVRGHPAEAIGAAPHRIAATWTVGGQEQFYLEGQIAYAIPQEDGCLVVHSSTQHPTEVQVATGEVLGGDRSRISVEVQVTFCGIRPFYRAAT